MRKDRSKIRQFILLFLFNHYNKETRKAGSNRNLKTRVICALVTKPVSSIGNGYELFRGLNSGGLKNGFYPRNQRENHTNTSTIRNHKGRDLWLFGKRRS